VKNPRRRERKPTGKSKSTMLTTREVANIFNVHSGTIRRWCTQDKIKSYRTGERVQRRFKREDVAIAYLEMSIQAYLKVIQGRA
jgi:excisionase family DNA binding protein